MNEDQKPIYRILLFSKIPTLDERGWPDCGTQEDVGFYYEYETAVRAMHENWCDIQEHVYRAAFLICKFPGLYEGSTTESRMYFVWDPNTETFVQQEEPTFFKHISL